MAVHTLCTSGLVDDVMLLYIGGNGHKSESLWDGSTGGKVCHLQLHLCYWSNWV